MTGFSRFLHESDPSNPYLEGKKLAWETKQLQLPWQDIENSSDCGIFAMRHMEDYKNQDEDNWNIGFHGKDKDVSYSF